MKPLHQLCLLPLFSDGFIAKRNESAVHSPAELEIGRQRMDSTSGDMGKPPTDYPTV